MALRKIAQLGDPALRVTSRALSLGELASPRVTALVLDMIETMRDVDGAGLAAPQVYEPIALVVIEVRQNARYPRVEPIPLTVLANPRITPIADSPLDALADRDAIVVYEGCLSVAGLRGRVRRPRKVRVEGFDCSSDGSGGSARPIDEVWEGFRAAVVQHEVDHLAGTLFVDKVDRQTLTFLREYERYVPADQRIVDLAAND